MHTHWPLPVLNLCGGFKNPDKTAHFLNPGLQVRDRREELCFTGPVVKLGWINCWFCKNFWCWMGQVF